MNNLVKSRVLNIAQSRITAPKAAALSMLQADAIAKHGEFLQLYLLGLRRSLQETGSGRSCHHPNSHRPPRVLFPQTSSPPLASYPQAQTAQYSGAGSRCAQAQRELQQQHAHNQRRKYGLWQDQSRSQAGNFDDNRARPSCLTCLFRSALGCTACSRNYEAWSYPRTYCT